MPIRRTREITIQTTETLSVRLDQVTADITCAECGSPVPMLTPEAIATAFGLSLRGIYRLVEAARVHFQEPSAGRLLVCPHSLQNLIRSANRELRQNLNNQE